MCPHSPRPPPHTFPERGAAGPRPRPLPRGRKGSAFHLSPVRRSKRPGPAAQRRLPRCHPSWRRQSPSCWPSCAVMVPEKVLPLLAEPGSAPLCQSFADLPPGASGRRCRSLAPLAPSPGRAHTPFWRLGSDKDTAREIGREEAHHRFLPPPARAQGPPSLSRPPPNLHCLSYPQSEGGGEGLGRGEAGAGIEVSRPICGTVW